MSSKCPKCGAKIKPTYLKQNCPNCNVNMLYYKLDEQLENDAKQAQKLVNTAEQQDKQIMRLKKEVKRLTTERDEAIRRAEAAEQKLKPTTSMKNLKKSNEKTEIIRQNELMKQALNIPQLAKYSDIRRYLQDNGLLPEQERKKDMEI